MFNILWDNINIFYANLTWFYIISMVVSWFVVVMNVWKHSLFDTKQSNSVQENTEDLTNSESTERYSLQTQYKMAKQKLVEKNLTPEQRSKEKEAEARQLAVILKLLQEQSDTFQVSSMDQLEDQLRLYRN